MRIGIRFATGMKQAESSRTQLGLKVEMFLLYYRVVSKMSQ
jgi:hypothetical protein